MRAAGGEMTGHEVAIRRSLCPEDLDAIADLHRRVYGAEYGLGDGFVRAVAAGVQTAVRARWPASGGGVWLIDGTSRLCGSLALTAEGAGRGRVRWFVLEATLRERGLGRTLIAELLAQARTEGMRRLELETFSALATAGRIYRAAGFRLEWERERFDWGAPVTYQGYSLDLG